MAKKATKKAAKKSGDPAQTGTTVSRQNTAARKAASAGVGHTTDEYSFQPVIPLGTLSSLFGKVIDGIGEDELYELGEMASGAAGCVCCFMRGKGFGVAYADAMQGGVGAGEEDPIVAECRQLCVTEGTAPTSEADLRKMLDCGQRKLDELCAAVGVGSEENEDERGQADFAEALADDPKSIATLIQIVQIVSMIAEAAAQLWKRFKPQTA